MKNIFAVFLILLALPVGAKLFLEFKYKGEFNEILDQISPFAEVVYKELNVGFDGRIELKELSITPNTGFNTISVSLIKISGLDLIFHFTAESKIKSGEFPELVNMDFVDFRLPAVLYEEFVTKQSQECRSLETSVLYSIAGFDEIVGNGKLALDMRSPDRAILRLEMSDQISNGSVTLTFNSLLANMGSVLGGVMPLQSVNYNYYLEEQSAGTILDYCAKQIEATREEYLAKVVGSDKFMLDSFGFHPGIEAQSAVVEFLKGGREISFTATPNDQVNFLNSENVSVEQLVRSLNLTVALDGDPLPLSISQSIKDQSNSKIVTAESENRVKEFKRRDLKELMNAPDMTIQYNNKPEVTRKIKRQYEPASLSNILDFIDKDVRVGRTKGRSAITGRLIAVEQEVVSIEIFRYGGTMTLTVPVKEISKFEVKTQ